MAPDDSHPETTAITRGTKLDESNSDRNLAEALHQCLDPGMRQVVAVDPITDQHGQITVTAAARPHEPNDTQIALHKFTFVYHNFAGKGYQLGLEAWTPPKASIGPSDMAMVNYVRAYFAHFDLLASVSVPIDEYDATETGTEIEAGTFEADAPLTITLDRTDVGY